MLEFNFTPFPQLTSGRLILRQLSTDDADTIFFLRSDERMLKYLHREPAASKEEAVAFINKINENVKINEAILWGMALKDKPAELIGTICFWNIRKEHHRAELGYVLHPDHWRKGLMKEAIEKVISYGFDTLQFHSMDAVVDPQNTASVKALEASGFIKEAHFKEDSLYKDQFHDTAVYSLLNKK